MRNKSEITDTVIQQLLDKKYKMVYSERLGRKVYVLIDWVEKDVFNRHKKLFGYTDVGFTVKYPKQLIRALLIEGIWLIDPIA